jgi:peptidoglycan/xylan/chitin deacetylase (PgdA/CDA1 family)
MKFLQLFPLILLSCTGNSQSADEKITTYPDNGKEIVCFVYHRVGDARYPTTNVSVKDFDAHLAWLVKNKFQVLTFSDALAYLRSAEPARKTAVITIDDAYKSFFVRGLPLLKKYGLPATLFMNTKTVDGGDYMNWSELATTAKSNVEIGNHTHSHDYFLNENAATRYKTFKEEIELSQSLISKNLDITPVLFSYPYGEFDAEMKRIVMEAGFHAAAAQNSGVVYSGTDMFMCPRFPMSEAYAGPGEFSKKASMKALRIIRRSPDNFIMPADKKPVLTLTLDLADLQLDQLQCFVQGGGCDLKIVEKTSKEVTITLQALKVISGRRRTLYTVTVPDKKGVWHWYSHLWINPKVE